MLWQWTGLNWAPIIWTRGVNLRCAMNVWATIRNRCIACSPKVSHRPSLLRVSWRLLLNLRAEILRQKAINILQQRVHHRQIWPSFGTRRETPDFRNGLSCLESPKRRANFNALWAGGFGQSPLMIAPNLARGLHTEYLCSELEWDPYFCFAARLLLVTQWMACEHVGTMRGYEVWKCLRRVGYSSSLGWKCWNRKFKHPGGFI